MKVSTIRISLLVLLLPVMVGVAVGQQRASKWSMMIGGQGSYGIVLQPEQRVEAAGEFLSGYSPAYGIGVLSTLGYKVASKLTINAAVGMDAQRFSFDLISPPTFGETNGRTVPGRYLTAFKGIGVTGFTEVGTEIELGSSGWAPALVLEVGVRYWLMEHSNASDAYAAGYQELAGRDDSRYQAHIGAGFGVSPFSTNTRVSLLFQRTLEPFEPLHETLVLRQTFTLKSRRKSIGCPTF